MRKWLRLTLVVLCVGLLCGITVYAVGRDANAFMGVQKTQMASSGEPPSGSLTIDGVKAPCDEESGVWYVAQDPNTEEWIGTLGWSDEKQVVTITDDPLLNDKTAALAEGHAFTVNVGTEGSATVIFTGLPIVSLHTKSTTPVTDDKYTELYEGSFRFFDPTGQSGRSDDSPEVTQYAIVGSDATWHARGATSMNFPKTSWRIELHDDEGENRNIPLLDLRSDDDWILMSMYNDDSKLRDKMSIDLWNAIAATNEEDVSGTRLRYVEVFVDDRYDGLYALMEPLDQKSIPLNPETDYLYKTLDWYCPTKQEMNAINAQTSRSFTLEWPKEYSGLADWMPLRDYIDLYFNNPGGTSKLIQQARINIPNIIDYALFVNMTTAVDNTFKNAYIWAEQTDCGTMKLYVFNKIPWDLNYTWGETWTDTNANYTMFSFDNATIDLTPGDLWTLINGDRETIIPMVQARWSELRETVFSEEALLANMEAQRAYLEASGAFARDTARWPDSGNNADLSEMTEYLTMRLEYLDEYYTKLR